MSGWNPWHGCHKHSEGCRNCYVYRIDERCGRDPSQVFRTKAFGLPVQRNRAGQYKIPPGETIWTCFSSDFLLADADEWRPAAWDMIRERGDLHFLFITKRLERLADCVPPDWGDGWDNVEIWCTCENQDRSDFRLPLFRQAPIKRKAIICEPLLGPIDLSPYLGSWVEQVTVGGESGPDARVCRFEWVLSLRDQCVRARVPFHFKQTGARFEKDGRLYKLAHRVMQPQARKAGIDYEPG